MLEQIKRLCAEKGVTIFRLERDLGFGNGTIGKWARSDPQTNSLKKVAAYFGVTVDELLKDDSESQAG